jgi:hypothetical protein
VCHGFDGKAINFKDEKKPEYFGTVGQENALETLHKIIFIQPGVGMVPLGVLRIQDQIDILAYTQTLPAKSSAPARRARRLPVVARLIYDRWGLGNTPKCPKPENHE